MVNRCHGHLSGMSKLHYCRLIVMEPADNHLGITQMHAIKKDNLKRKVRLANPLGAQVHPVSERPHRRRRKTRPWTGSSLQ